MAIIRGNGMAFEKITNSDLIGKLVAELPDVPEISSAELKARFDALGLEVLIPRFNDCVAAVSNEVTDDENTILTGKAVTHFLTKELFGEVLGYTPADQKNVEALSEICDELEKDTQSLQNKCAELEKNMKIALHECAKIKSVRIDGPVEVGTVLVAVGIGIEYTVGDADIYVTKAGDSQGTPTHVGKADSMLGGTMAYTDTGLFSQNTTYVVKLVDSLGHVDTRSGTLIFCNGVYTGNGAEEIELNILTKKLQQSRAITFTATAGENEYIWYACPKSYGTPKFSVGGFEGGFSLLAEKEFTNPSGYSEVYQYWRSDNDNLGKQTVAVS